MGFALAGCDSDEGPSGCRLKRINTPHYAKGYKLGGSTNIGTAPARTTQNSTNSTHQQPKSEGMLQVESLLSLLIGIITFLSDYLYRNWLHDL